VPSETRRFYSSACHYLPESYPWIDGRTPRSVWFRLDGNLDLARLKQAILPFGNSSLVVKDYVKSQKHLFFMRERTSLGLDGGRLRRDRARCPVAKLVTQ
jgi:hypothetical protein